MVGNQRLQTGLYPDKFTWNLSHELDLSVHTTMDFMIDRDVQKVSTTLH